MPPSPSVLQGFSPFLGLEIGAFRALRDMRLANLTRVNLLVGSGNSGKTSILEALALLSAPANLLYWQTIARTRDLTPRFSYSSYYDSVRWFFPHTAPGQEYDHSDITLECHQSPFVQILRARCEYVRGVHATPKTYILDEQDNVIESEDGDEDTVMEDEGWRVNLDYRTSTESASTTHTFWAEYSPGPLPRGGPRLPCQFLPPYSHRNQPLQLQGLSRAVEQDEKNVVVGLLNRLDSNIQDIEIITDKEARRPILSIRHRHAGLVPISVLGDGTRRALAIALAVQQSRNGILLVDEIEAALHVSALDKFFPWLEEACTTYNVQLFATTHSLEAISAISVCASEKAELLAAYHLPDSSEARPLKRYSGSMLKRLVAEGGLDIR